MSYDMIHRCKKKFYSELKLIENVPRSGRPKSASCDEIVPVVKEIVERDAMYIVRDIAQMAGTSLSTVHYILSNIWNVRKISARWVPHLLTDGQKKHRFKIAKQLLKIFPNKVANLVTGGETWFHYLEPIRKVSNKIWATKNCKTPIVKYMLSAKGFFLCNFLDYLNFEQPWYNLKILFTVNSKDPDQMCRLI